MDDTTLETDYQRATRWLCDRVEDQIVGGRLLTPTFTFHVAVLTHSPGFQLTRGDHGFGIFTGSEEMARRITEGAWQFPEVYELCAALCWRMVGASAEMPTAFRQFVVDVLAGRPRPKRKRGGQPKPHWIERELLFALATAASANFGLLLTRNDESAQASAADALAEALSVCGRATEYIEIKNLLVHPDFASFRQQAVEMAAARRARSPGDDMIQQFEAAKGPSSSR